MLEKEIIQAKRIREKILMMVLDSGEGHIASSFSIVEILIALISVMRKENKGELNFKNIILSKGHASYAYYALLNYLGVMSDQEVEKIGKMGSKFYGHLPYVFNDDRFSYGSGSLGHGLPYALGLAVANSILKKDDYIYCIVGDGEANEGTFWETLLLSQKFKSSKLRILVDCNSSSERAIPISKTLHNLENAFESIDILSCDGHNIEDISTNISKGSNITVVLCNTIKGYPSKMMANNPIWHHRTPNAKEADLILKEIQ